MFDNSSTSSLSSFMDERPERRQHQGWRKPVPKFIPDPPKRQSSLLANSSALRRMALFTSGEERPPLPSDWKENIDRALGREQFYVERPSSPTPDAGANIVMREHSSGTLSNVSIQRLQRGEKALPMVPKPHEAKRHSDTDSTLAGSIQSMKLEASDKCGSTSSAKSLQHGRARSLPTITRASTPPLLPARINNERRHTDGEYQWEQVYRQADATYRIVYPRTEKEASHRQNWRHAAVFPVFPGSNTDVSIDVTAVDSTEDVRSLSNRYPSTAVPSTMKPGASSMHDTSSKCESLATPFEPRSRGLRQRMRHAFREWFCLNASPARY
ncbi:hypothetical protein PHLGIDRAFT_210185 [Phlebiopsis gigantea 11061_1 CR5-6]|uniref:Uncharacterized protein n=1 Tax=Phlebiopsis gigantea (strain 11061_1 CR5-6) TaxID=745531 RepID=A0A0C3S4K4_PHLG1|nr:hypothetical protein PHLGIDRAFT_210185 [Phlebiopsis gigantea 11061_1 CR5-6]